MKTRIILFLLFFQITHSQNENILRIQYIEYIAQHPKIVVKNIGALFVSKNYSYYKVEPYEIDENKKEEGDGTIIIKSNDNKYRYSEIIVNKNNKNLTERLFENIFLKKHFAVNEDVPVMKWKILDEEKKIKNYTCKKAKISFRGRSYTAWYTEKIPFSSGPWKFNGLPGLIISVSDDYGIYKWEANIITYPYKGNEIDFKKVTVNNPKYKSISYKDFDQKRVKAIYDKIETVKARNANREEGKKASYSYSTFLDKEPVNEWRRQDNFE
jgi:GLPGLI family protein